MMEDLKTCKIPAESNVFQPCAAIADALAQQGRVWRTTWNGGNCGFNDRRYECVGITQHGVARHKEFVTGGSSP